MEANTGRVIGIDARFYGVSAKGLGRYTERLVRELEKQVHPEDRYIIFLLPENWDLYIPKHPNFTKQKAPYPWYGLAEQLWYPGFLRRHRLDLMHFPHFNVPLLYRGKFVVTIHDLILWHYPTKKASTRFAWLYWLKYWVYKRVIASSIHRAEKVIAVSEFTRNDIVAVYPEARRKVRVTLEGVDVLAPADENPARLLTKRPYCLYVGNAYPHKNLETLLEVAVHFPEHDFVLVGKRDYFYARLEKMAQGRHCQNVVFWGHATDEELVRLYRGARVYLFPSLYEGFGLPPLEAMQYGVPVVAARCGSLPEVLGEAALLVAPTNKGFRAALEGVLENEHLRKELIMRGRERVKFFSWERMAQETRAVYNECI